MNTEFTYLYRDAANYKTHRTLVLEGTFNEEELMTIHSKLEFGDGFIPSQVGLEDLQFDLAQWGSGELGEDDHVWHEWPSELIETEAEADGPSCSELAERFKRIVAWDDLGAMEDLGIPAT